MTECPRDEAAHLRGLGKAKYHAVDGQFAHRRSLGPGAVVLDSDLHADLGAARGIAGRDTNLGAVMGPARGHQEYTCHRVDVGASAAGREVQVRTVEGLGGRELLPA